MINKHSMSQCCSLDYMKGYNATVEKSNIYTAGMEQALTKFIALVDSGGVEFKTLEFHETMEHIRDMMKAKTLLTKGKP
jgi:hypothetical protein